jgi:hypothetical protein
MPGATLVRQANSGSPYDAHSLPDRQLCRRSDSQSVPVRVGEMDLTAPWLFHDVDVELVSYGVYVSDPQVDERVGLGIAKMFGQE